MKKRHACARCKRHVSPLVEVRRPTGWRSYYCRQCIEAMSGKGRKLGLEE